MKAVARSSVCVLGLWIPLLLGGCAVAPVGPPYYDVAPNPTPGGSHAPFAIGAEDRTYLLEVEDRTPFGPFSLPQTLDSLYQKGYDEVPRKREADLTITVNLSASARENPDVRAGNALGGALAGAAAGAIIGGALGDPGYGAAVGAASGGALGLVSPAATPMVRIDLTVYSVTERRSTHRSVTIDLSHVPPQDARLVVDKELVRMMRDLPER